MVRPTVTAARRRCAAIGLAILLAREDSALPPLLLRPGDSDNHDVKCLTVGQRLRPVYRIRRPVAVPGRDRCRGSASGRCRRSGRARGERRGPPRWAPWSCVAVPAGVGDTLRGHLGLVKVSFGVWPTQCSFEDPEVLDTLDLAERLLRFDEARGGPAQRRIRVAVAGDAPAGAAHAAVGVLDDVGRAQGPCQRWRQPQGVDGERLVQPFAQLG